MRTNEASGFENEYFLKKNWNGGYRLAVRKVKKGTSMAKFSQDAFREE